MRMSLTRPRPGTRILRSLAIGAVSAAGLAALPGAAAAQSDAVLDPQTTNVPYLAWRGEQIRLATCMEVDRSQEMLSRENGRSRFIVEEFLVEDWSGPDPDRAKPQVEQSTKRIEVDERGRVCFSADVVSLKAGIAPVKLIVTFDGTPVLKHQFLAVWMNTATPRITEVAAPNVGDPLGDGEFIAGARPGRVRVDVTGTIPLLGNYAELGLGTSLTLPADYARLAGALARSDDPNTDRNPLLWDVHDDQATTEGHPAGPCGPGDPVSIDAGDDCRGGTETGPFSAWDSLNTTAFLSSDEAIGPFDPVRAEDTYLPDGKLDAGDAPMPALRVDVAIAPNSGGPTDISGVGTLEKVDKGDIYSRSGSGTDTRPHQLYAPFYKAYLPATAAPGMASGIDGPQHGTNFPGFLNEENPYDFWDIAYVLRRAAGGSTNCLRRADERPVYRQRPSGAQSVVVYSDEHGEAQVAYRPGVDAYYDALVTPDRNGACDLQGIDLLGTADIQATARYPYQPVTDPDKASATLRKNVRSRFNKVLSYAPKGTTAATQNVRIVTAHAQDVDGAPFVGETVCFSKDANGESIISMTPGATVPDPFGGGRTCVVTDRNGNAVVEVLNSNGTVVDVIAHFTDERLFRDIKVNFGVAGSSGGTPPPVASVPGGATSPGAAGAAASGASAPTARQAVQGGVPAAAVRGMAVKASRSVVRVATLVRPTKGRAYVSLRVDAASNTAAVRVRMLGRAGRSLGSLSRTVATGRRVRVVLSAAMTKKVRAVRVALR